MTYHIGQIYPPATTRRIVTGPETAPVWYCLKVPPMKERAAREFLRIRDIYAFYPSEEKHRIVAGRKRTYEHPIITGHVYAQFRQQPQWDVLKRVYRLITGVYSNGEKPIAIPRDVIHHLQGLPTDAELLKAAQEELLRIRAGDVAEIVEGPLAGFCVNVVGTAEGEAFFEFVTGGKGRASLASLRRRV